MKCYIALVSRFKEAKSEEYFECFSIKYSLEEIQEKVNEMTELNELLGFKETRVEVFLSERILPKETV